MSQSVYFGVIENRQDPLELGRCQTRVVGLHTHDKNLLPTSDLPWCAVMQPTTSSAMNGIGHTPIGPVEGSSVIVTYLDDNLQQGLIMGTVGGLATEPLPIDFDDSGPILETSTADDSVELRSVITPTTGNHITLYDPLAGRLDITSALTPNMRVTGYGVEYGTTIVSIDSGTEITISSSVRDFGENILRFDPPLESVQDVISSQSISNNTSDRISVSPTKENLEIPVLPPLPEFQTIQTKASTGIRAVLAACDKVGLTTKQVKCSILGILGAESSWLPQIDEYIFNPSRLKEHFPFATDTEITKYSNANDNNISRVEFFEWVYGTSARGENFLGNRNNEDGGRYYSRGLIRLVGRTAYTKYNTIIKQFSSNTDIVENPDILISDVETAALVAVLIIKDKIEGLNRNLHPDFFLASRKLTGTQTPDSFSNKLRYYEYFYGTKSNSGVDKEAGAIQPTISTTFTRPGQSEKSIKTDSFSSGFRDPNNKYPLETHLVETDVNRLARGIVDGTIVKTKNAGRRVNIPKANGQGVWEQPETVYNSQYPFNKVFESESGHIQEFDDTPGYERTHTYHRSGTFTEVDPLGTQVNYIVGDHFTIMERNGCISVSGECNITVKGDANIFAQSDANVEVSHNACVTVGNNLDIGVANHVEMAVGGDYSLKVDGDLNIDAGEINIKSRNNTSIESIQDFSSKAVNTNIHSTVESNYLSGAGTWMNYTSAQFGVFAKDGKDVSDLSLSAPPVGEYTNLNIPFLVSPPRQFENYAVIETPEGWDTPEGRSAINSQTIEEGSIDTFQVLADEEAPLITGGRSDAVTIDHSQIDNTLEFTNDYMLSPNISLGMVISGGVNGKHKLRPQTLQTNTSSTQTVNSAERLYTVQETVGNLAETANNVLERIMGVLPSGIDGYQKLWDITSGYRLRGVIPNETAGSEHCKGHCIDITLTIPDNVEQTYKLIQKIEPLIVYDQLILMYRYPDKVWIHIGYKKDNNRGVAFTMVNNSTYKRNKLGLPSGFFLINNVPPLAK